MSTHPGDPALERFRINLTWLIKLRWAAIAGQMITIISVSAILGIDLPWVALILIVAVTAITNLALVWMFGRRFEEEGWHKLLHHGEPLLASVILLDVVQLTALLYVTGGAANPFAVFFLVNLALGAAILPGRWAWTLSIMVVLAFGLLLVDSLPLEPLGDPGSLRLPLFLQGMFVAVGTAAGIIVYFVSRLRTELARLEGELEGGRRQRAQDERLAALATLAGGAAHELSSPLSTIAVVARELQLQLEEGANLSDAVEDAALIRREVSRCRTILDRMSAEAGESAGEKMDWVALEDMISEGLEQLPEEDRTQLSVDLDGLGELRIQVPRRALAQTVRDLVRNGLDASEPGAEIHIRAARADEWIEVEIEDHGAGMPADVQSRAGEPFFTTKEPGRGMGLGLFLARTVVERMGGQLRLHSIAGQGTMACIRLPRSLTRATAPPHHE
jgi:two-component system sensor histidine kinase RegB